MMKKNLDLVFSTLKSCLLEVCKEGSYLDCKFIQITEYWEVILDVRCIGLLYIGPVLFPYEGMFWQALALVYFF